MTPAALAATVSALHDRWGPLTTERAEHALSGWWRNDDLVTDWHRFLLHDSDYCPFKLGRQPSRDDRTEPWEEV